MLKGLIAGYQGLIGLAGNGLSRGRGQGDDRCGRPRPAPGI